MIAKKSASLYGEKRWAEHQKTVAKFWERVADYLLSLDAARLKIYQDGLAADGDLGRQIVEEAAKRGSLNHQLLWRLLSQGAKIRKTEDATLLLKEYEDLTRQTRAKSPVRNDGLARERLTEKRDTFVAKTINETLAEGEVGVLFMGAYHDILAHLSQDIVVKQLKERGKVVAYFNELVSGREEERLRQLALYLTSPVALPLTA
ncbi:MAG: hypothetical protein HY664_05870 [Chloroflexi bacterium]|nr:hypothetical protein [Chloroflexota bacterium]